MIVFMSPSYCYYHGRGYGSACILEVYLCTLSSMRHQLVSMVHNSNCTPTYIMFISGSGSHLTSAQMVLSKQAEWAAVDSTTLLFTKKFMYDGGKDIITLETLGRLPPYPIVVNSRLKGRCYLQISVNLNDFISMKPVIIQQQYQPITVSLLGKGLFSYREGMRIDHHACRGRVGD